MNAKQDLYITHYEGHDGEEGFPANNLLTTFRDWLNEQIQSIPAEFQSGARIDISTFDDNIGDQTLNIEIWYRRMETDSCSKSRARVKSPTPRLPKRRASAAQGPTRVVGGNEELSAAIDRDDDRSDVIGSQHLNAP